APPSAKPCSAHLEIGGRSLAALRLQLERDLLALVQRVEAGALDGADMHEDVLAAIARLDEAVTFGRIEPLDSAAGHEALPGWLQNAALARTAREPIPVAKNLSEGPSWARRQGIGSRRLII